MNIRIPFLSAEAGNITPGMTGVLMTETGEQVEGKVVSVQVARTRPWTAAGL